MAVLTVDITLRVCVCVRARARIHACVCNGHFLTNGHFIGKASIFLLAVSGDSVCLYIR
jgi:hypothetical protein